MGCEIKVPRIGGRQNYRFNLNETCPEAYYRIGRKRKYYEDILRKLNGVLIPGGAVFFKQSPNYQLPNDCVESSKFIYEIVNELNEKGIYFPIWGTCLGFQLLLYHAAVGENTHEVRCECATMDCSLPISFESNFHTSKMFANFNKDLRTIMETEPIGYHYHRYAVTRKALIRFQLDRDWQILATNKDHDGLEFITFIEHIRYPFYGCQVHLERVAFEVLNKEDACVHSPVCIAAAEYFAKFFVYECSKCPNYFDSVEERLRYSIQNFQMTTTAKTHWVECYLFSKATNYPVA